MKHIKLFENFGQESLFNKIDVARAEMDKRGVLPISNQLELINNIITKLIGYNFDSRSSKDSFGELIFIGNDEFEMKIRRLGDDIYLINFWPERIDVQSYTTDYIDGLEECLTYLFKNSNDKSPLIIDNDDY